MTGDQTVESICVIERQIRSLRWQDMVHWLLDQLINWRFNGMTMERTPIKCSWFKSAILNSVKYGARSMTLGESRRYKSNPICTLKKCILPGHGIRIQNEKKDDWLTMEPLTGPVCRTSYDPVIWYPL